MAQPGPARASLSSNLAAFSVSNAAFSIRRAASARNSAIFSRISWLVTFTNEDYTGLRRFFVSPAPYGATSEAIESMVLFEIPRRLDPDGDDAVAVKGATGRDPSKLDKECSD